jgi:CTP:phosphocholine cytidylyltransferase-like protein
MDSVERMRDEVKKYIDTADEKVVKMVYAMLEVDNQSSWWDAMPDEVKKEVDLSMKQADSNDVMTHDAVKATYPQWFTK